MKKILSIFMWLLILSSGGSYAVDLVEPTRLLNGTAITYHYTISGRAYKVKFEEAGVSYRYLTGSKPDKWWGPFPYKAFETDENVYLAAWFEAGYADYVTLLINLNENTLYGSAILGGKNVHFHGAEIVKIEH